MLRSTGGRFVLFCFFFPYWSSLIKFSLCICDVFIMTSVYNYMGSRSWVIGVWDECCSNWKSPMCSRRMLVTHLWVVHVLPLSLVLYLFFLKLGPPGGTFQTFVLFALPLLFQKSWQRGLIASCRISKPFLCLQCEPRGCLLVYVQDKMLSLMGHDCLALCTYAYIQRL